MSAEKKLTTAQKLNLILSEIEASPEVCEDILNRFYLLDPLQFAKLLHSLESLPDPVKGQLLVLKVNQRPEYKGPELGPIVEKAMSAFWQQLAERMAE